ncbi:DNA-binding response OmpR family regulator [Desulfobaculum xiamenense]|uniref:DNA-binding response OmpR family regulator n=1 Tax=Desulfobaculum xiamenense TaxID=995050 RepID=A0A846QHQ7_9BACT|nr:response regulator transcription factor [Desulfobaculum xiamenense]NJB67798.1 DNA-binding response OmpR family regulator [Desulfobaculum xiamenense]
MRILVVEDERKLRFPLAERLAARRIDADCAAGAREAVMFARMMRYDAAVIDVQDAAGEGAGIQRALTRMQPWMQVLVVAGQGAGKGSMPGAESEVIVTRLARALTRGDDALCA